MSPLNVERSMNAQFLSNTYLVSDGLSGSAFFVDAGGPVAPLIRKAGELELSPTHVLLTHHHHDHVSELEALRKRWPDLEILIDPRERELLGERAALVTGSLEAGEKLTLGALRVVPLSTPGHTAGMLSFLVGSPAEASHGARAKAPGGLVGADAALFTGDTLFRGSVGGLRAPGHTSYTDLRDSIMGTLMELAPGTVIYPGHTEATTVAQEWESNPFIRVWRGLDRPGTKSCVALGRPATLVLMAEDYDGGRKAWVRWPDGSDDILPGSRVA